MITEMISKYAYELYKADWKHSHGITAKKELYYIRDYFDGFVEDGEDEDFSYEEYLEEFGYDGECYVCYEEFLDMEYHDKEYICSLLKYKELIKLYYKDINADDMED